MPSSVPWAGSSSISATRPERMVWKIGILGLIHDHVWEHVGMLAARDDVTLAVADPNAPLRDRARATYGVERCYDDPAGLLEREHPDAVLIFSDNRATADLVELAASHGKPMMVEKPLSNSLANAERIRVAVQQAGVPLMVNWPTYWTPAIRHAPALAARVPCGEGRQRQGARHVRVRGGREPSHHDSR